jgi:hypothetical protein
MKNTSPRSTNAKPDSRTRVKAKKNPAPRTPRAAKSSKKPRTASALRTSESRVSTSKPRSRAQPAQRKAGHQFARAQRKVRTSAVVCSGLTTPAPSKQAQLIELLGSTGGASMDKMIALTGWQGHTVRGALSGTLRKRLGLDVYAAVEGGVRIYRIRGTNQESGE